MRSARADIVIFGGGVAGLWTRAVLRGAGYSVVLIEREALGAGQSIASQGILHSGVKYAFSAAAREASEALLAVQPAWKSAFLGASTPNLSRVRSLTTRMHLWSTESIVARATAAAGAKALNSLVRAIDRGGVPRVFCGAAEKILIWEIQERAVDSASLLEELRQAADGPIVRLAEPTGVRFEVGPGVARVGVRGRDEPVTIDAQAVVFAAGGGNEALLRAVGIDPAPWCQRRPLHMVLARGVPHDLFGHCIAELSDKPRLTVTTSRLGDERVWCLGGQLAESGVERDGPAQIAEAKAEVATCLPWIDVSNVRWASFRIDRAEGKTPDGRRPDVPVLHRRGRVLALWPTKLALAPAAAGRVRDEIQEILALKPVEPDLGALKDAPTPGVADAPWAWKELAWS